MMMIIIKVISQNYSKKMKNQLFKYLKNKINQYLKVIKNKITQLMKVVIQFQNKILKFKKFNKKKISLHLIHSIFLIKSA